VKRYESGPGRSVVLARLEGTGTAKPLLLLHHMDVVPTDPSRWTHAPFGAEIAGGNIWGRGTMDMKGLGVVQLMAFLSLKRQGVPLNRDVILMAVPDEETGGALGADWMRANHYSDFEPEYIIDEGGFGSRDLFAPGKLVFGISVAEKKILWLKVRAEGIAGHGSQPNDQNPNDRLIRALARLLGQPLPTAPFAVLDTMKARVGPLAVNKFNNAIQHSTISITSLRSGVGDPPKANVIPSVAEATLDCRVLPGTTKDQWLAEIARRLGDPEIKIEVIYEGEDPIVTTQDSVLYRALESAVKRRHPDAIVTPMTVPYGTDANDFRPRGVKAYGFTPVIVPAAGVMSMHGDAEFLPVDAVGPAIQILFEALRDTVR
jgi:acetylornithine deacetylase/succinyl-diaminopimelate desuccinylase-like protein